MLKLFATVSFIAFAGCATQSNSFHQNRFESARYPYAVHYAGDGPREIISRDWQLTNYYEHTSYHSKQTTLEPKKGRDFEVKRRFDVDGDGTYDTSRTEPFYDLLLEHARKDAELWVRTVPLSSDDRDKELNVIAERYIETASGAGAIAVQFGNEGAARIVERRFATRVLGQSACEVSRREAHVVEFEVANVDQLQLSEAARWLRGRLAIVRPNYTYELRQGSKVTEFPVLMLVGFSASPNDFDELATDFDRLLGQIALGTAPENVPSSGRHTCTLTKPNAVAPAQETPAAPAWGLLEGAAPAPAEGSEEAVPPDPPAADQPAAAQPAPHQPASPTMAPAPASP